MDNLTRILDIWLEDQVDDEQNQLNTTLTMLGLANHLFRLV